MAKIYEGREQFCQDNDIIKAGLDRILQRQANTDGYVQSINTLTVMLKDTFLQLKEKATSINTGGIALTTSDIEEIMEDPTEDNTRNILANNAKKL